MQDLMLVVTNLGLIINYLIKILNIEQQMMEYIYLETFLIKNHLQVINLMNQKLYFLVGRPTLHKRTYNLNFLE